MELGDQKTSTFEEIGVMDETKSMNVAMNGAPGNEDPTKVGSMNSDVKMEERDDGISSQRETGDRRDETALTKKSMQIKHSPKARKGNNSHHSPHQQRPYAHEGFHPSYNQPPAGRNGHYSGHPGMHGGPRGPPPGPYPHPHAHHHYYNGNPGAPHDHFRGAHPHHYHQMPPLPHPGQPGHYGGRNGHYSHPPNMPGRPGPPPGYHPNGYGGPYPGPPPPMGYHSGPPPQSYHSSQQNSDSNSISSSRSKRSHKSHSSTGSRKKRTIEGFHESNKDKSVPLSYSFRRTNSSSSNSTATASKTVDQSVAESPNKRERSSSRSAQYLPPMSRSTNIFDESDRPALERSNSGNSTTSSLSGGGFSLSSYEGSRGMFSFFFLTMNVFGISIS